MKLLLDMYKEVSKETREISEVAISYDKNNTAFHKHRLIMKKIPREMIPFIGHQDFTLCSSHEGLLKTMSHPH